MKSRLRSIDCLRALAALAVCLGHGIVAGRWEEIPGRWFHRFCEIATPIGALGVPLFFVISGFCIHLTQARATRANGGAPAKFQFGAFWRRRLWRLYPTYFLVLCGSMLLLAARYARDPNLPAAAGYPIPKPLWMFWDFLAHATMTHGFWPQFDLHGGNPPFWTLAREEYLYALYPVLLLWRRSIGVWPALGAVVIASLLPPMIGIAPAPPFAVITASVLPAWIQWSLGAVAAEAYCGNIRLPGLLRAIWAVPFWVAAAELVPSIYAIGYAMAFFTLINWWVAREMARGWVDRGPIRALAGVGTMSYSLYLVHAPVQDVMMGVLGRLGTFDTPALYLLRVGILVAASIAVGRALFALFESRFLFARRESEAPAPVLV